MSTASHDIKTILTHKGKLDDLSISDCSLVRLEQMSEGCYWLACYRGDERISIFLHSKKRITANINEDELECEYQDRGY